jgi:hypothetical protein
MGLLSSIGLPYGLMITGAVFMVMGFVGLAFTRNKEAAIPRPPISRSQMPPLPKLFDSSSRKNKQ